MNCMDYIELLSDYLDQELEGDERSRMEQHFKECEGCRHLFDSFRTSVDMYHNVQTKPCPPDLEKKLFNLVMNRLSEKKGNPAE